MNQAVLIWLKIILGFIFSVCVVIVIVFYALTGTVATDTLEIVITEATGLRHQEVMFSTNLQPLLIVNTLWFSVLVLGFCLIFLYFLERSVRSFLAPGVLSLLSVGLIQVIFGFFRNFMPPEEEIAATGYVYRTMERADQASLAMAAVGILLIVISYLGQRRLEKLRRENLGQPAQHEDDAEAEVNS